MATPIDDDVRITVRAMRTGGFTTQQIAHSLGLSLSTVSKYCFAINEARGHRRANSRSRHQHAPIGATQPGGNPT